MIMFIFDSHFNFSAIFQIGSHGPGRFAGTRAAGGYEENDHDRDDRDDKDNQDDHDDHNLVAL